MAIWLVFLGSPLEHVWQHNSGVARWVGFLAVVGFGVDYLVLFATARMSWRADAEPWRRGAYVRRRIFYSWLMLGGLAVLILLAIPFAGSTSLTMVVYLGAAAMFTFRPNVGVVTVVLLAVVAEVSTRRGLRVGRTSSGPPRSRSSSPARPSTRAGSRSGATTT